MRLNWAELSTLPVYRSLKDTHYYRCRCQPIFSFPTLEDCKYQLYFGTTNPNSITDIQLGVVRLIDAGGDEFFGSGGAGTIVTEDVNNDGTDEYFINIECTSNTPIGGGCTYYHTFLIDGVRYYTEVFSICDQTRFKLEFWNDNDTKDFGYFSGGYKNTIFINDTDVKTSSFEETLEEAEDGFNDAKTLFTRIKTVYNVDLLGSNPLHQSLTYAKYYDNIRVTDLETNEVFDLEDFEVTQGGDACSYNMRVTWVKHIAEMVNSAKSSSYENAPFEDCDPVSDPPLVCGSFDITLSETAGELSYVVSNNPNPSATLVIQWFLNNVYVGSGSTVTLGQYGTYKVRATVEDCVTEDEYVYNDPCTMSLDLSSNGAFIYGTINNAPGTPTVSIKNDAGTEVGTALPYEALATGTYTVIITDGVCQVTKNIYINITSTNLCDFDFSISKNAVTKELSITSNTCSGSHVTTWYKVTDSDTRTQVATAIDTYQPTENAAYIASVECDSECTVEHLYVVQDFVDIADIDYNIPYQLFDGFTGSTLPVTKFDLPNRAIWTVEEMNARLRVYVEGTLYQYADTPASIDEYNIDLVNNEIELFFSHTDKDVQVFREYL